MCCYLDAADATMYRYVWVVLYTVGNVCMCVCVCTLYSAGMLDVDNVTLGESLCVSLA